MRNSVFDILAIAFIEKMTTLKQVNWDEFNRGDFNEVKDGIKEETSKRWHVSPGLATLGRLYHLLKKDRKETSYILEPRISSYKGEGRDCMSGAMAFNKEMGPGHTNLTRRNSEE